MASDKAPSAKSLAIGLASADPSWQSLLDSEGLPWRLLGDLPRDLAACEVAVLPADAPAKVRAECNRWAERGGSLVIEMDYPTAAGRAATAAWPMPYHAASFAGLADEGAAEAVRPERGTCGAGTFWRLPLAMAWLWPDHGKDARYICVDPSSDKHVFECMARIVKKNVRRVAVEVLRRAMFERGLPLVRKWYWPGSHRSVFCYRGDCDGGNLAESEAFVAAVKPSARRAAMFICASNYDVRERFLREAAEAGIELGSHGWWHIAFPDRWTNDIALGRTERFLESLGSHPAGFVGPAYFWYPALYRVLERRGYRYSSSFGFDHDNWPCYPVVGGRAGSVLEIPHHAIGDLVWKFKIPLDGDTMRQFFAALIRKKHAAGEPILLYGHPGVMGAHPDLLRFILDLAASYADVWPAQLRDLERWWADRHQVKWRPTYEPAEGRLACAVASPAAGPHGLPRIHVECPDGRAYLADAAACAAPGLRLTDMPPVRPLVAAPPCGVGEVFHRPDDAGRRAFRYVHRHSLMRMLKWYAEAWLPGMGRK